MNYAVLGLLIAACIFETTHGQAGDCPKKLQDVQECLKKIRDRKLQSLPNPDEVGGKIKKCFTDNGCKDPSTVRVEVKAEGEARVGRQAGFEADAETETEVRSEIEASEVQKAIQSRLQCLKDVKAKAGEIIEKCVQQKVPGWKFPHMGDEDDDDTEGKLSGRVQKLQRALGRVPRIWWALKDPRVCDTNEKAEAVGSCAEKVLDQYHNSEACAKNPLTRLREKEKELCDNRAECEKGLSAVCIQAREDAKKAVCNCTGEVRKTENLNKLQSQYESCLDQKGVPRPNLPALPVGRIGPPILGGPRDRAPEFQRLLNANLGRLCQRLNEVDPCYTGPRTTPAPRTSSATRGGLLGRLG